MRSIEKEVRSFAYSSLSSPVLAISEATVVYFLTKYVVFNFYNEFFVNNSIATLLPAVTLLSWILCSFIFSVYLPDRLNSYTKILYYSLQSALLNTSIVLTLIGLSLQSAESLLMLAELMVLVFFVMTVFRCSLFTIYKLIRSLPKNRKPSIIVGYNSSAEQLFSFFKEHPHLFNDFKGILSDEEIKNSDLTQFHVGKLDDVQSFCLTHGIKEIYFASASNDQYLHDLKKFAEYNFIYLGIVPEINVPDDEKLEAQLFNEGRIPVISYRDTPLRRIFNSQIKRTFDIFFSSVVLLFMSVTIFPVIAILIKLDSPGPIFFKQLRPGLHNRLFWCFKFRTMCVNQEECKQATRGDARITKIGAFLRKTSLDELPQFFNVLLGDMSVVGPRPNMQSQLEFYSQHIDEYPLRHSISPGITGFAQISGYRGETKEMHLMQKRVDYDLIYMQNWSLKWDIVIILMTIRNIFKGENNAY